jgi:hypothetical protein
MIAVACDAPCEVQDGARSDVMDLLRVAQQPIENMPQQALGNRSHSMHVALR